MLIPLIAFCTLGISEATTVGTLADRVRQNLAQTDSTNSDWTQTQIRDRLWESSYAIAMLTECIEAETTLALVANQRDYTPGSSFYGVKAVSYLISKNYGYLNRVDVEDMGRAKDSLGKPITYDKIAEYAWFNNKVKVFPVLPKFSYDSLIVTAFKMPAQFTADSQTTQMPVTTDWLVEIGATMMCQQADMTVDELMAKLQQLIGFSDRLIYTSAKRHRTQQIPQTGNVQ